MKKIITIKLINGLGNLFETYLTMLSQKVKNKNKFSNLSSLFSNLENKKCCIKQTTKVNFAQSQNTSIDGISLKNGLSLYAQDSQDGCG